MKIGLLKRPLQAAPAVLLAAMLFAVGWPREAAAQPEMLHPRLEVNEVTSGLQLPTTLDFIGENDILVLERNTGQVKRVVDGAIQGTVLDLAVNSSGNSGLLGIAVHPDFAANNYVYLYWTETESGQDSNVIDDMPLLGNRVDRFIWDGESESLTFDHTLKRIRSLQEPIPGCEPFPSGVHDGGVLRFGPDGKLHVFIGDMGRRGQMQNLPQGHQDPSCEIPDGHDDTFGGPEPDDAHLTGVILRLNDDGTAPSDNPFYDVGAEMGGEVGANLQKLFSYGHRNSFGMDFDPISGDLWVQENGDDTFSELNRVIPGLNSGWVQIMGPVGRIDQYKEIETSEEFFGLQQQRWPPTNIADTPEEALDRLFMLPGAQFKDPEFSWKWEVAPAAISFVDGRALGPQFSGDLFMGAASTALEGGYLFHFNLTGNRLKIGVDDPRLEDRVADNLEKHDLTESESLLIGRNFGIATDIRQGPNGNLFVVSLTQGAIYEISAVRPGPRGRPHAQATGAELPDVVALEQNYPNPFNPATTIRYGLPEATHVRLEVFDVLGRRVALLVDGVQDAGWQEAHFDADHLPSGIYVYRLETGSIHEIRSMHLLR